jgi:B12-binding domain/radical SAM domain protein
VHNIYFVKDKFNKYSIRALLVSVEKFFPKLNYFVINDKELEFIDSGIIFYSFMTFHKEKYVKIAEKLKSSKIVQICGGPHPSAKPFEMLKTFDAVCIGEGEFVIVEIIDKFLRDEHIQGIFESQEKINLDEFKSFSFKTRIFGPIEITRGCLFKCAYCQVPSLYGNKLRHRSLHSVLKMTELAYKNFKKDIRFISPDVSSYLFQKKVNIPMIKELLTGMRKILKNDGRIFFGSFPSELNPYFANEELIYLIKNYCNNNRIVIGLQTASVKMLKKARRPSNLSKVEETISILLKYGFNVDVDIILGMPGENDETIFENIEWINKWKNSVRIHAHYFMPLPSSEWENEINTELPEYYINFLHSLEGKSQIFGQWKTQRNFVRRQYYVAN